MARRALDRLQLAIVRFTASLRFLAGRRAALLLLIDAALLLVLSIAGMEGEGSASAIYLDAVLLPFLLLGVPLASDLVAVERRSGMLPIVLSTPGARHYFERRLAASGVLMCVQGLGVVIFLRLAVDRFPVSAAIAHLLVISVFILAAVFFWALHLRAPAGVAAATILTCALLARPLFVSPIYAESAGHGPMEPREVLELAGRCFVLLVAAAVLYGYGRRRLQQPDSLT